MRPCMKTELKTRGHWSRLGLAGLMAVLVACASDSAKTESAEVPADVSNALLPPVGYASKPVSLRTSIPERFDVNVKDVPAQSFFMSLVDGTPYNVVVQPGVSGSITLNLKQVTVPEVLDYVRDAYGYNYQKTQSGYTVLAETMQTRTFTLNYLNVKRGGKSRTSVSSGQLTDKVGASGGAGAAATGDSSARGTVVSSGIETESTSDFWKEVDRTLRLMLPEGSGRKLVINPDAGLIVARGMTSELREIEKYIRALQNNLSRQVILETKILEVRLNENFQAGINWSALGTTNNGYSGVVGQFGSNAALDNGANASAGNPITVDPVTGAFTLPIAPAAIGGAVTAVLNINDFNAVIELLQGQGDVKVLSSPRVSTVNNQKAIIKVGSDEFFVTGVSSNAVATGGGTQSNRTVEFTPFFSGIALDVTPQIDEDNVVTLHVHPSVSQVDDQVKTLQVGTSGVESFPLALSNVREADSIVRARSGQIIVIGGLMQESDRDDRFGIPVLSRLPLIGFLFRQTRVNTQKSELVILLKPLVMESDEQWAEEVRKTQQRAKDLEKDQRDWWN